MADVQDVAQYVLEKCNTMTTIKLQKLVYYCQAWSLVWVEKTLFSDKVEAWANGPVVPTLYSRHRGQFQVSSDDNLGVSAKLTPEDKTIVDAVLSTYAGKNAQWLVELTHLEEPWKNARQGIPAGVRSNAEITTASMHEYYSGL